MTIELNVNTAGQDHQKLLSSLIESSDESILCSGWLKTKGIQSLEKAIKTALNKQSSISIMSNFAHTHKRATKLIGKWGAVRHFMTKPNGKTLHSKVYYFRQGSEYVAIVGSANITQGGLMSSDEASLKVTGVVGDDFHNQVKSYLDGLKSELN